MALQLGAFAAKDYFVKSQSNLKMNGSPIIFKLQEPLLDRVAVQSKNEWLSNYGC